jgi:hypothetical protein
MKKKVNKENLFAGEKTPSKALVSLILTEHQLGRKNNIDNRWLSHATILAIFASYK